MAPWAIHLDAHLTGRYMVIYSATKNFLTVILRSQSSELAPIRFVYWAENSSYASSALAP